MAADAVDSALRVAGLPGRPCPTAALRLHGWTDRTESEPWSSYGSDAPAVRQVCAERPEWHEPLHPDLPYRAGEVAWVARHEWARTVEDVLARRTRALILDSRASAEVAERVADILAAELGRDDDWRREQVRTFRDLARDYLP